MSDKMRLRLQSAMEYLMTYGWAILIIAVVLGALFQLGIFNASTFTPKAPPGACHVFRPNGPGTTSFINLQGICNGELPQYVGVFSGSSYIKIPASTSLSSPFANGKITITVWINVNQFTTASVLDYGSVQGGAYCTPAYISIYNKQILGGIQQQNIGDFSPAAPIGTISLQNWYFASFNLTTGVGGSTGSDGSLNSAPSALTLDAQSNIGPLFIGSGVCGTTNPTANPFYGKIANVQIYNTTLSSNEIVGLYNEGIGGAPVKLSNLVGWWPLNGDAKDYSGNNNNGVPTAVSFTSSWESGYSAP